MIDVKQNFKFETIFASANRILYLFLLLGFLLPLGSGVLGLLTGMRNISYGYSGGLFLTFFSIADLVQVLSWYFYGITILFPKKPKAVVKVFSITLLAILSLFINLLRIHTYLSGDSEYYTILMPVVLSILGMSIIVWKFFKD